MAVHATGGCDAAMAALAAGDLDRAEAAFRALGPGVAADHGLGLVAYRRGDLIGARRLIGQALRCDRSRLTVATDYAAVVAALGDRPAALAALQPLIDTPPTEAAGLLTLAACLLQIDATAPALVLLERLAGDAGATAAHRRRAAEELLRRGRVAAAAPVLARLSENAPGDGRLALLAGNALGAAGALTEAETALQRAVAACPDLVEAWCRLGLVFERCGRPEAAYGAYERAHSLDRARAEALEGLGRLDLETGDVAPAVTRLRALAAAQPGAQTRSLYLFALTKLAAADGPMLAAESRRLFAAPRPAPPPHARSARLRVGYLSSDFGRDIARYQLRALIGAHDRARVAVHLYGLDGGAAALDGWHALAERAVDLSGRPADGAAAVIAADRIDVLVDLCGHTFGPVFEILARRPAPRQVSYYFAPTGAPEIDALISDPHCAPAGDAAALYGERLLILPRHHLPFVADAPFLPPDPRPPGPVVFGSFNRLIKISPRTLALWAEILDAVPGARLLVKAKELGQARVQARFTDRLMAAGIDPARVTALGGVVRADHLRLFGQVDVMLDTIPYNGALSTGEALSQGVPVVTLAGRLHYARVGSGFLAAAGLTACIAEDGSGYVAAAVSLAAAGRRDVAARADLADRFRRSVLCDPAAIAADLETALLGSQPHQP